MGKEKETKHLPTLNSITLGDNKVLLDGVELKGVREIEINNFEASNPQIYELTLKMDVFG